MGAIGGVADFNPFPRGNDQGPVFHRVCRLVQGGFLFHIQGAHIAFPAIFRDDGVPLVGGVGFIGDGLTSDSPQDLQAVVPVQGGKALGLSGGFLAQGHAVAGDEAIELCFIGLFHIHQVLGGILAAVPQAGKLLGNGLGGNIFLANPGNEYAKTRHNVGFMLVDALAEHLNINLWKDKFNAQIAEGRIEVMWRQRSPCSNCICDMTVN